jgi:surfactin family lipopeptide synthetase A
VETVRALRPDLELTNHYGPTEATVGAVTARMQAAAEATIPIGRPLAGVTAAVLNEDLDLVPAGTPGELYLGGRTLSRGYLNQPRLTALRFVPSPLGDPGERLYATGDRAVRRTDGQIVLLGRFDHQIKVDGYRVELEEIERVGRDYASVAAFAATVRPDPDGRSRIVGFFVAEGVDEAQLRGYFASRLPHYMVPSRLVAVSCLPRTAQGKVDRTALKDIPIPERIAHVEFSLSPTERRLVELLSDVVPIDERDVSLNFFDLGWTSLDMVKATKALELDVRQLSIEELFASPSIRELARRFDAAGHGAPRGRVDHARADQRERAEAMRSAVRQRRRVSDLDPKRNSGGVP